MSKSPAILVVDDQEGIRLTLRKILEKEGYSIFEASNGEEALNIVKKNPVALAIVDYRIPEMNGVELIKRIRNEKKIPVIIITAYGFEKLNMQELNGALDYITKPFDIERIRESVASLLEREKIMEEIAEEVEIEEDGLCGIVGKSSAMLEVYSLIKKVAPTDFSVLITGESGSGKELCARAIHHLSRRKDKPFISVACSAIPETLLESELFGYEKGAFTGAEKSRPGKFELANSGTIFLDEIGDMPLFTQAKILRVLQEKEVERLGSEKPVKVDVRIISATNVDLTQAVKEGKFREDLYYRLNVFHIHLPPLRERREDIPLLVLHFLNKYAREENKIKAISIEALEKLINYNWPGNVRELENVIQRAIILAQRDILEADHIQGLKEEMGFYRKNVRFRKEVLPLNTAISQAVEEIEKELIMKALQEANFNKSKAAELLKISRKSLHNKLKKYNLN
ncbi:MAG TPA: sigma-54-dependent Fis family transcriptional regulator [Candidatus Omnitrophica bacterium]|nr:sigma-54-dependent Fis family transcriptional regulator [Candidatus Omnitrophota bacterium]